MDTGASAIDQPERFGYPQFDNRIARNDCAAFTGFGGDHALSRLFGFDNVNWFPIGVDVRWLWSARIRARRGVLQGQSM
jgi:hypothetical protein